MYSFANIPKPLAANSAELRTLVEDEVKAFLDPDKPGAEYRRAMLYQQLRDVWKLDEGEARRVLGKWRR